MTDPTPRNTISALADHPVTRTVSNTVPLIRAGVLAVSVAAAIPTAHNLYYSWAHGIPYSQVPHRLAQYDLWMKNLDCKIEYRQLLTTAGTKVDVGACPKSQDIAIKVSGQEGQATYEWIAFDQLQKPTATSLLSLIGPAYAEDLPRAKPAGTPAAAGPGSTPAPIRVAENGMQVMCQAQQGNQIIRIVQDAGKCYREVVSMFRGSLDKRVEVPCTASCK